MDSVVPCPLEASPALVSSLYWEVLISGTDLSDAESTTVDAEAEDAVLDLLGFPVRILAVQYCQTEYKLWSKFRKSMELL